MGGYEFVGWERLSYYTSNAVFSNWLVDHLVIIGLVGSIWYAIASVTPWTWDDKLVEKISAAVKEKLPKT